MRIEQIHYFVETVNSGSLSNAAQKLKISQPALSISIANLENELNIQLLNRSYRGITLTPKGKLIYEDCVFILETIEASFALWKNKEISHATDYQNVHILCIPALVSSLNDIVTELAEQYPLLNLHIDLCRSHDQFSALLQKKIPLSIGCFTTDEHNAEENLYHFAYQNNLIVETLFIDDSYLVLSTKNPLANKSVVCKDDIANLSLAYSSNPSDMPNLQNTMNIICAKNIYRFSTRDGIFKMIAQDAAVTIESGYAVRQTSFYQNGEICLKPIIDYTMKFHHYILHPPDQCLNENEMIVLEAIRKIFSL